MALVVGLTGGIGCGKTTVSDWFAAQGVCVIDADVLSRQLTQAGGVAIPSIRDAFGPDFIGSDGALDRVRMRQLVFADEQAKARLEALLHPLILADCRVGLEQATDCPYVLLVVPLLLQHAEFAALVQRVLVIDCEPNLQITRVMARSGMTEQAVRLIMQQQLPRQILCSSADDVLDNSGSLDCLQTQLKRLHQSYLELANKH